MHNLTTFSTIPIRGTEMSRKITNLPELPVFIKSANDVAPFQQGDIRYVGDLAAGVTYHTIRASITQVWHNCCTGPAVRIGNLAYRCKQYSLFYKFEYFILQGEDKANGPCLSSYNEWRLTQVSLISTSLLSTLLFGCPLVRYNHRLHFIKFLLKQ